MRLETEKESSYGMNLWHLDGALFQKYRYRVKYDVASKFEAKVESVFKEKQWIW